MSKVRVVFKWFIILFVVCILLSIWHNWNTLTYPFALDFYFQTFVFNFWIWFLISFFMGACFTGFPLVLKLWIVKYKTKEMKRTLQDIATKSPPLEEEQS